MYLYKKSYVKNWRHTPKETRHSITVRMGGKVRKDIKRNRISSIVEEVAYWRKFNALHAWFISNCADGVDDCKEVYVSTDQLKELLETLKKVKASLDKSGKKTVKVKTGWSSQGDIFSKIKAFTDTSLAEELFPTQSGFFFGGTEYDKWYYQDLKDTIKLLEKLLAEDDNTPQGAYGGDFYYRASW